MFTNYYLGKKFDGWKVVSFVDAPSKHKIYTLTKGILWFKKSISVRDNVLTDLRKGNISVKDIIKE